MAGPSSIRSAFSRQDPEVHDFNILFGPSFNVQEANYDLLNKYVVYKVTQYRAMNIEDYSLWESIQMDFVKFRAEHFDSLDNVTLRLFRDYCYPHGFWIELNLNLDKNFNTAMLEAVAAEWNNKWSLEQIEWVEERYRSLSRATRERKQELTGTLHLDSASNPELNTARQGTQQYQNLRYQTPPQQPPMRPLYPAPSKPSPYTYQTHQVQQPRQPAPTRISNPAPPTSKITEMDVGRYNIRNRRNDHQPVPTRIFYPAPPTSKIQKNCECISERSTALTLSTQALPIQVPVPQAPPIQATPAQVQASPTQRPPAKGPAMQVPPMQTPLVQSAPIQAPLVLATSMQAHVLPIQAPPIQALSLLAPSVPTPLTQVLPAEQATSAKENVTPDKDVTSEEFVTP